MSEASSSALQALVGEFKNISPQLTRAFVIDKNGEILANDPPITGDQARKTAAALSDLANQAEVIGGLEKLTIQSVNSKLNIASANDNYVGTVSSPEVSEKMVEALTCVIVPTVIQLMNQNVHAISNDQFSNLSISEIKEVEAVVQPTEEPTNSRPTDDALSDTYESDLLKPPVNQLMVKKINGFFVASDSVRIDSDVVSRWIGLCDNREIMQVNVETLAGKAVICKVKPIKEGNVDAKGLIQIPERIMEVLQTDEGKLVRVKPIFSAVQEKKS